MALVRASLGSICSFSRIVCFSCLTFIWHTSQAVERDNESAKQIGTLDALEARVQALESSAGLAQRGSEALDSLSEQVVELEEELEQQHQTQLDSKQQVVVSVFQGSRPG